MHHGVQVELLELLSRQSHRGRDLGQPRHSFDIALRAAVNLVVGHRNLSLATEGIR